MGINNLIELGIMNHSNNTADITLLNNIVNLIRVNNIVITAGVSGIGLSTFLKDLCVKIVMRSEERLLFLAVSDFKTKAFDQFANNINTDDIETARNLLINDEMITDILELKQLIVKAVSNGIRTIVIDDLNDLLIELNHNEIRSFVNFIVFLSENDQVKFIIGDTLHNKIARRVGLANRMPKINDITYKTLKSVTSLFIILNRLSFYGVGSGIDGWNSYNKLDLEIHHRNKYIDKVQIELANRYAYK